jgi:hypothetical protein
MDLNKGVRLMFLSEISTLMSFVYVCYSRIQFTMFVFATNLINNNLCSTRLHVMIFATINIDIPAAPVHRRDSCKAKTPRLLSKGLLNPKHLPLFFKINLIKFKSFGHLD